MSMGADETKLTRFGTVTILAEPENGIQIVYSGFGGKNCSCRDIAVLAGMWAIGVLQRETIKTVEKPGGGASAIGELS